MRLLLLLLLLLLRSWRAHAPRPARAASAAGRWGAQSRAFFLDAACAARCGWEKRRLQNGWGLRARELPGGEQQDVQR
jgi:hypothetical protein